MPGFDLFGFLDGASPWWWIAAALALGAAELLTFTYYLLWLGIAAGSVGLILFVLPDLGGTAQLVLFAVLAVVYTLLGHVFVRRRAAATDRLGLNERAARLIGRQVVVKGDFSDGFGPVEIDGIRWRARLAAGVAPPDEGERLTVGAVEGMTLVLERTQPGMSG